MSWPHICDEPLYTKVLKKNLIGSLLIHISRSTPKGFLNYFFSNVSEYNSSYLSALLS